MIHSSRWYYVLSIGFLVNFCIIIVLVIYIVRWKRNRRNLISTAQYKSNLGQDGLVNNSKRASVHLTNSNNNSTFSTCAPVKSMHSTSNGKSVNGKTTISMPYYDNDSSSEDDQLFRKPYTDEVKWYYLSTFWCDIISSHNSNMSWKTINNSRLDWTKNIIAILVVGYYQSRGAIIHNIHLGWKWSKNESDGECLNSTKATITDDLRKLVCVILYTSIEPIVIREKFSAVMQKIGLKVA
jgi:hypothetical protein